jgi:hypothetical protein
VYYGFVIPKNKCVKKTTQIGLGLRILEGGYLHLILSFQDEEFRTMLRAGERMEFWYGHWFDLSIVNENLDEAFEEVARAVRRIDQDAQWVPASWVQ